MLLFSPLSKLFLLVCLIIGLVGTISEWLLGKLMPGTHSRGEVTFSWRWHRYLRYWYSLLLWLAITLFPLSLAGLMLYYYCVSKMPSLSQITISQRSLALEYRSGLKIQLFWRDIDRIEHDQLHGQLVIYGTGKPLTVKYSCFEKSEILLKLVQDHLGTKFC